VPEEKNREEASDVLDEMYLWLGSAIAFPIQALRVQGMEGDIRRWIAKKRSRQDLPRCNNSLAIGDHVVEQTGFGLG
jgi:hypothetical protein